MKKKAIISYIVLAAALAVLALTVSLTMGRTYTVRVDLDMFSDSAEDLRVEFEDDVDSVELIDRRAEDGQLLLTFRGVHRGRFFVSVTDSGDMGYYDVFYVHPLNIITHGYYFGRFDGDRVIPACVTAYLIILLAGMIVKYRIDMRRNMYQYRNIRDMGLILFLGVICLHQSLQLIRYNGLLWTLQSTRSACSMAAVFLLPVSFIISAIVTVSNVILMKREGKTWRNMLGCIVGVLYCAGMLLPRIVSQLLEWSPAIDMHNERAIGHYIEIAVEGVVFSIVFYLVCVLIATIILGLKSARHVPKSDKDYILILGCKVRRDGTLTADI